MAEIVKFPQTVYEKIVAQRKRRQSLDYGVEIYYGDCAASAWLDTDYAKDIAYRVANWVMHSSELTPGGLCAAFPPGWHFEMIHGRPPYGEEEATFWADMRGESEGFRIGFTRGLLHIVPMVVHQANS